jgi:hypothetical protein
VLHGGPGNDHCLFSADGIADDTVSGGGGEDRFEVDLGDRASSLETTVDCHS